MSKIANIPIQLNFRALLLQHHRTLARPAPAFCVQKIRNNIVYFSDDTEKPEVKESNPTEVAVPQQNISPSNSPICIPSVRRLAKEHNVSKTLLIFLWLWLQKTVLDRLNKYKRHRKRWKNT